MGKYALISVHNKSNIIEFVKNLVKYDFKIVSTGGTASLLTDNGIEVISVTEFTGFPEILSGRVKTLNPKIFAGILADKTLPSHNKDMSKLKLTCFDLVVVNLYPFKQTIETQGVTLEDAIEQIDIGGVSLIRAAAKNFKNIDVLIDESQYEEYIDILGKTGGKIPSSYSFKLSSIAFKYILEYDYEISNYFEKLIVGSEYITKEEEKNNIKILNFGIPYKLRYGENPDQEAYLYKSHFDNIFKVLHGKEISYNNLLDIDAAIGIINEFKNDSCTTAIVKHGNPCGVATADSLRESYLKAFSTDTSSPFGGIMVFNKELDINTSIEVDKIFSEIIIAPGFTEESLDLLKNKKNRRLISFDFFEKEFEIKSVFGGFLYQIPQRILINDDDLKIVTKISPSVTELEDMKFAVKVVKHTKSNAIVFVKNKQTLGIGCGQPSRIDSTKIAIMKAKQFNRDLNGSVVASDAFFPFADSIDEIYKSGSSAIVQPGGSVRDDEVIVAADKFKMSMVFTGIRYFKH